MICWVSLHDSIEAANKSAAAMEEKHFITTKFIFKYRKKMGCVAHIVHLIDNQSNKKIVPRGYDFYKSLIQS